MELGLLQETKSILKSLVISYPSAMTLDRLNKDYKDIVGEWIPFKKLGHANLEIFLKSLPDTLVVTGQGRDARIGFVSDKKTKHIDEMISKQKNTTRERKVAVQSDQNRRHASNVYRPAQSWQQNVPVSTYNAYQSNPTNVYHGYPPDMQAYRNVPINHPIQMIRNYLLPGAPLLQGSYLIPLNLNLSNLNINNSRKTTSNFGGNYKNNTTNQTSVEVNSTKILSEPRSSINFLPKQKTDNHVSNNKAETKKDHESEKYLRTTDQKRRQNKDHIKDSNTSNNIVDDKNNRKPFAEIKTENKLEHQITKSNDQTNNSESKSDKDLIQFTEPPRNSYKNNESKYTPIINSSSKINKQNQSTECKQYKYTSNKRNINITIANPQNSISKPPQNQQNKEVKPPISSNMLSNIKYPSKPTSNTTIKKPPNFKPKPVSHYSKQHKIQYISETNDASSLEDEKPDDKIFKHPFLQNDSYDNDIDEAVPEFAADNKVFLVDFPENTVEFGRKLPSCRLPKELKKNAVVGVFISEIHSPFKFWFHIHKDNHELDVLMSRIECFYDRLYTSELVIPKTCLAPGQVCAALFNTMWHRAEILTNVSNNKVKVLFVDYGTVSEVDIQNIKYLPNIFADTSIQAIRGSLSHIKPVRPLWPKSAVKEFLDMVSNVLLYAQIVEVDEKDKTVYMVLCDTNQGRTVQINKELVDRGFAKLDSEWDENKIRKNGYRKRHPREIFPTFEMLETGEYPSLYELDQLLAQGIDYEKITEKIILSNINCNTQEDDVLQKGLPLPGLNNKMSFNLLDSNPFKSDIISEIVSLKIFND